MTDAQVAEEPTVIRAARPDDVVEIVAMIRELAAYERAPDEAKATPEHLHRALFGPNAGAHCLVGTRGPRLDGFALWFLNFSTWRGVHGIYLEDLYVRPEARGRGLGRSLLRELARICVERGYERLDWQVLDWNDEARRFYASLGAHALTSWVPYRLSDDPLLRLASDDPPP